MANHVIRDRIWRSKKLRDCSLLAAIAYPTIYLVADAWGRFEYDPRGIWAQCFAVREDVSVDDVTRWLAEYERVGLLVRYHIDGDLAYWTNFYGRKSNKRAPSQYPDPAQFTAKPTRKRSHSAAKVRPEKSGRTFPPMELERELELEGDREKEPAPAVAVAIVPAPKAWSAEAIDDHRELRGEPVAGKLLGALKPLVDRHTWEIVRPVFRRWLESDEGKFGPHKFAENFVALSSPRARAPTRATVGSQTADVIREIARREGRT